MRPLNINDIVTCLFSLRDHNEELSRRLQHEEGLPEDAIPFLAEKLEAAFARCETTDTVNRDEAYAEMAHWLVQSYRFYMYRLMWLAEEAPWTFHFESAPAQLHH